MILFNLFRLITGLCFLIGIFLVVVPLIQLVSPQREIMICTSFILILWLQRWLLLAGCLIASMIYAGVNGDPYWWMVGVFNLVGWLFLAPYMDTRCPRCGYPVVIVHNHPWLKLPRVYWCTMCGRSRLRVTPLQYRFKPEAWDGAYHDEGGGPAPDDSIMDWMRDLQFRWKQKRMKL